MDCQITLFIIGTITANTVSSSFFKKATRKVMFLLAVQCVLLLLFKIIACN
jgi:VIT1/CCC1 family predicted Fe2+/Mn2+ transporter